MANRRTPDVLTRTFMHRRKPQQRQAKGRSGIWMLLAFLGILVPLAVVLAQTPFSIEDIGSGIGLGSVDLRQAAYNIIRWTLGILALVAVAFIIYGGILWLTSQGDERRIEKAKRVITSAVIGLIIVLLSWALVAFIFNVVIKDILNSGGGGPPPPPILPSGHEFQINDFETARPIGDPPQSNVYLCSDVQTLFNRDVEQASFDALVANGTLKVLQVGGADVPGAWARADGAVVFNPTDNLLKGSLNPQGYEIQIPKLLQGGGNDLTECDIPLGHGTCADNGTHFAWRFNTGEETDTGAPAITTSYPVRQGQPGYPDQNVTRQPILEVIFDEPIRATSVMDGSDHPLPNAVKVEEFDENHANPTLVDPNRLRVTMVGNGFQLSLIPPDAFQPFRWYRITVSEVSDLCGNLMDPRPIDWEFQTNDQIAGIQSQYPTGNTACPETSALIVFNTTMFQNRVEFTITGDGTPRSGWIRGRDLWPLGPFTAGGINGTVQINDYSTPNEFRVFEFIPAAGSEFQPNTTYTVSVTTDRIINQNGDTLNHIWNFTTATSETCACQPFVSHATPPNGPRGQCITVFGQCFTGTAAHPADPTQIAFTDDDAHTATQNVVAGSFSATHIVTTVPNDPEFQQPENLTAAVTIDYDDPDFGSLTSSPVTVFNVNSNATANGPCLFSLDPPTGLPASNAAANGDRFDGTGGLPRNVRFGAGTAPWSSWTNTRIDYTVPNLSCPANYNVAIQNDVGTSNPLPYALQCAPVETPVVIERWPTCDAACTNAEIGARFNRDMDAATLDATTVKLHTCPDQACTTPGPQVPIANIQYIGGAERKVTFAPQAALAIDTWHRVLLGSGIRDTVGTALGGLNFPSGTPDSYSWVFKTKDGPCDLRSVDVAPAANTMTVGETDPYFASAFGSPDQCNAGGQPLNAWAYPWTWDASGPEATISPLTGGDADDPIQNVHAVVETAVPMSITAATGGYSDFGVLTINPPGVQACNAPGDCLDGGLCPGSQCVNNICTPTINDFNPLSGPEGTWVSVNGCWFGGYVAGQSKVEFTAAAGGTIEGIWPNATTCGPAGTTWHDRQIVIEVPDDSNAGPDTADGPITVTRSDGMTTTSSVDYDVNLATMPPGLCRFVPASGSEGMLVSMQGKDFGPPPQGAGDSAEFFNGVPVTNYTSWADEEVIVDVPIGAQTGDAYVYNDTVQSNGLRFTVNPPLCTVCAVDGDCAATEGCGTDFCCHARPNVVSVEPVNGSTDVCRNTVLRATFDQPLDPASVVGKFSLLKLPAQPVNGTSQLLGTVLQFTPAAVLDALGNFRATIEGGAAGVANGFGVHMAADYAWQFTTAASSCSVSSLECFPGGRHFTKLTPLNGCANSFYQGIARSANGNQVFPDPGVYDWDYSWATQNPAVVDVTSLDSNFVCEGGPGNLQVLQNGATNLRATITGTVGWTGSRSCLGQARVEVCENPWTMALADPLTGIFEDTANNCTLPGVCGGDFNFSLGYCRGNAAPLLPDLTQYIIKGETGEILKEFIFKEPGAEDDAIGIRILANEDFLSPGEWYRERFPDGGSPQTIVVDGYEAVRDGRTVYVAATNYDGTATLYPNIYLISYNQDAKGETIAIFQKLLASWTFNRNVSGACGQEPAKACIARDLRRLTSLGDLANALETYEAVHGSFPTLPAGTFIPGMSTSSWPSWQATFGNALNRTLPTDPKNGFVNCPAGHEPSSCWNEPTQQFVCPQGSHVYMYRGQADLAHLFATLEYDGPGSWNFPLGQSVFPLGQDVCPPDNALCPCFNYKRDVLP